MRVNPGTQYLRPKRTVLLTDCPTRQHPEAMMGWIFLHPNLTITHHLVSHYDGLGPVYVQERDEHLWEVAIESPYGRGLWVPRPERWADVFAEAPELMPPRPAVEA